MNVNRYVFAKHLWLLYIRERLTIKSEKSTPEDLAACQLCEQANPKNKITEGYYACPMYHGFGRVPLGCPSFNYKEDYLTTMFQI